ncbi:MAG: ester cyclase [Dehalococcoidia bacterium]
MAESTSNLDVINAFHAAMEEYFRSGDDSELVAKFDPACPVSVPGMPPNIDGMRQALPAFRAAFSDVTITLGEVVSSGEMFAYRMTFAATHSGDFMGVPATGRQVSMSETHIERIRDGRIVSHSGDIDMLGLLQQIGAIPAPK